MQEHAFQLPIQKPLPTKAWFALIKQTCMTEFLQIVISWLSPVISYLLKATLMPLLMLPAKAVVEGISDWILSDWMQLFWSRQQSTRLTGDAGVWALTFIRVTSVSAQFWDQIIASHCTFAWKSIVKSKQVSVTIPVTVRQPPLRVTTVEEVRAKSRAKRKQLVIFMIINYIFYHLKRPFFIFLQTFFQSKHQKNHSSYYQQSIFLFLKPFFCPVVTASNTKVLPLNFLPWYLPMAFLTLPNSLKSIQVKPLNSLEAELKTIRTSVMAPHDENQRLISSQVISQGSPFTKSTLHPTGTATF